MGNLANSNQTQGGDTSNSSAKPMDFTEEFKDSVIKNLLAGTSILQEDRKGIDFSSDPFNKPFYNSINQFILQQKRKTGNFINNEFITTDYLIKFKDPFIPLSHFIKDGELGSAISFKGQDGSPHYTFAFNKEQLSKLTFTTTSSNNSSAIQKSKKEVDKLYPNSLKKKQKQSNPYSNITPYRFEVRDDSSVLVAFLQKYNEYMISIYSGEKYKGWKPTPEQIKELEKAFADANFSITKSLNSANPHNPAFVQTQNIVGKKPEPWYFQKDFNNISAWVPPEKKGKSR